MGAADTTIRLSTRANASSTVSTSQLEFGRWDTAGAFRPGGAIRFRTYSSSSSTRANRAGDDLVSEVDISSEKTIASNLVVTKEATFQGPILAST